MFCMDLHPLKAEAPIEVTVSGILTSTNFSHPANERSFTSVIVSGTLTCSNLMQPPNNA